MSKTQGSQLTPSDVMRRVLSTAIESASSHTFAAPFPLPQQAPRLSATATWLAARDVQQTSSIMKQQLVRARCTLSASLEFREMRQP